MIGYWAPSVDRLAVAEDRETALAEVGEISEKNEISRADSDVVRGASGRRPYACSCDSMRDLLRD